jgi:hypothetical protein
MDYTKADSMLQGRCRMSRKLGNNTYLLRGNEGEIAVKLHATHILTFYKDGSIRVCTGGWNTVTTRARMNVYLPSGYSVGTNSKEFGDNCVLHGPGWQAIVDNAFIIPKNGRIPKYVQKHVEKVRQETREAINERARVRRLEMYWVNKARRKEKFNKPLTLDMIQAERNVTVRTAMISCYGLERFLTQIDAKILDIHGEYQLLSYPLDVNGWPNIRALKMVCPSTKTVYIHPVEPRCESVAKALDWMFQTENYLERLQAEA